MSYIILKKPIYTPLNNTISYSKHGMDSIHIPMIQYKFGWAKVPPMLNSKGKSMPPMTYLIREQLKPI